MPPYPSPGTGPCDRVFDWDPDKPDDQGRSFRWFAGGQTKLPWH